ncbi:MAG: hypothetical protein OER89_12835 [Gemmatimonadota bacterium]|nr:hypothetical protein [Gemmatimonadota bacterium]
MYALGEGVPHDLVQAYQWLYLAAGAESGDASASAASTLEELTQQMQPAQIAEAERRSAEWRRGANQ